MPMSPSLSIPLSSTCRSKQQPTMGFDKKLTSFKGNLSTRQTLQLANFYLENAHKLTENSIVQVLCHDAELAITHASRAARWAPKYAKDLDLRKNVAAAYSELANLQAVSGQLEKAQASKKHAEELGYV